MVFLLILFRVCGTCLPAQAPLLPLLARRAGDPPAFARALSRAAAAACAAGALLAATWGALAAPVVSLFLQRSAFDAASASHVALLLAIYTAGAPAYLLRDALARACYAAGDGAASLGASGAALVANLALNWLLGVRLGWGVAGAGDSLSGTVAPPSLPFLSQII